jgi:hypothetical protein
MAQCTSLSVSPLSGLIRSVTTRTGKACLRKCLMQKLHNAELVGPSPHIRKIETFCLQPQYALEVMPLPIRHVTTHSIPQQVSNPSVNQP